MMKKSSRKLSEARGQSKWKKTSVKSRVRNWKLGSQNDERRSFSPATVVRRASQLEGAQTRLYATDSSHTLETLDGRNVWNLCVFSGPLTGFPASCGD